MTEEQVQYWFDLFGNLGYIVGFLLPFIEAFIPILPIIVFVIVNVNAYGFIIGTLLAWMGTVAGSYIVFLFFRRLTHTRYMKKIQQRTSVQRLIHFIDRKGVLPIFILMCFPFTPSALVNIVASLSHIKAHVYLTVLIASKFVMVGLVGWLGNDITTLFTSPTRLITIIIVILIVWFVGRKIEKHFMHSSEE
ncbi:MULTISPECIES: TVP38/TMEM64 family protein [Staphylococcus]|uniref:TVP38/TMEM64 family membrane protein n=1 Tax=Staphylococcus equorum TaxID=246432 RepID=A0AAP7IEV2_9STAP|nr:TVP38/TMEM64 family protein [Staphylococcus equorum]MCE5006867.1 TVP38/TMEM64 family protein [Staphylococcus equorum]MCM3071522.1 TVP38/TMEM64 family protein [Staphylococcus equorum]MDK9845377.1 TVP38/TMEM64 family protein [Staphylococcus equorum]MDK9849435.1 TVP38/TMEM64 family protein [Staphylococcus equorum]MDK9854226.1 TVP38/TMEM64 family protein [Staphylococcus equorum]